MQQGFSDQSGGQKLWTPRPTARKISRKCLRKWEHSWHV